MQFLDYTENRRIVVAVQETLRNALYRGNLEIAPPQANDGSLSDNTELVAERLSQPQYADRKIRVEFSIDRKQARFRISDDGPGFDHQALFHSGGGEDNAPDMDHGRGIMLMRSFMDEIFYNEAGNEVTLVKRCSVQD